jgi:hypothetical protein
MIVIAKSCDGSGAVFPVAITVADAISMEGGCAIGGGMAAQTTVADALDGRTAAASQSQWMVAAQWTGVRQRKRQRNCNGRRQLL